MLRVVQNKSPGDDMDAGGQAVVIAARWLLIVAGLVITFWSPAQSDLDRVRANVFVLLALAAGNFYLHAQMLLRRRVEHRVLLAASAADVLVVTLVTALFGGLNAATFVFYAPALIALALAFPGRETAAFTYAALALYAAISAGDLHASADAQRLTLRLIALGGAAAVAALFRQIERKRGNPQTGATPALPAATRTRTSTRRRSRADSATPTTNAG